LKTLPKMKPQTHKLYFNDVQQDVYFTGAHTTVLVMGRRGGKTFRVQVPALLRNVQQMPGSCGAMIDEAKFINFEKLKDEVLPANGGFRGDFPDCPWHHSVLITSDMPHTSQGTWFLSYETEEMQELIRILHGAICELWRLKDLPETPYTKRTISALRGKIKALQSVAVYYREASTIENLQVVGGKYIRDMKRQLRPQVFRTSILCQKPGRVKDGFYPSFARKVHCYTANNNDALTGLAYDFDKIKKLDSAFDTDVNRDEPLCIACDYNDNISTLVVGQLDGLQARIPNSFFTKYNRKIREVVADFGEYYRTHQRNRTIVYYYNQTAKGNGYGDSSNVSFYKMVVAELRKKGFYVIEKDLGATMQHHEKYTLLDDCFKGLGKLIPRINEGNNEDLIISMEKAQVRQATDGKWKKDKSGEKKPESEEDLLQHRTDFSDAFDDLMIGMTTAPYRGGGVQGTRFPRK
jgi:hypothetical protein